MTGVRVLNDTGDIQWPSYLSQPLAETFQHLVTLLCCESFHRYGQCVFKNSIRQLIQRIKGAERAAKGLCVINDMETLVPEDDVAKIAVTVGNPFIKGNNFSPVCPFSEQGNGSFFVAAEKLKKSVSA